MSFGVMGIMAPFVDEASRRSFADPCKHAPQLARAAGAHEDEGPRSERRPRWAQPKTEPESSRAPGHEQNAELITQGHCEPTRRRSRDASISHLDELDM
jgi:hypothetical protein